MSKKKLSLTRETLSTLSMQELDGVNGGVGSAVFTASVRYCNKTRKIARAIPGVVKATRKIGKYMKDHPREYHTHIACIGT
jgi:hypothetical protein